MISPGLRIDRRSFSQTGKLLRDSGLSLMTIQGELTPLRHRREVINNYSNLFPVSSNLSDELWVSGLQGVIIQFPIDNQIPWSLSDG